jgi:hypothetical protein
MVMLHRLQTTIASALQMQRWDKVQLQVSTAHLPVPPRKHCVGCRDMSIRQPGL